MQKNLEIELKTLITKEEYDRLIKLFELENNIYTQKNHYFDTEDHYLQNNDTVLRIREKKNCCKLTAKCHSKKGAFETHLILTKQEAQSMINDGFDASIIDINKFVTKQCELTTFRCKTPYKNGTIFLDKSEYYTNVDYEIEFEADSMEVCTKEFYEFLDEFNIKYRKVKNKSNRAFDTINQ